jgi:DNA-binding CsgD family transcriptional regulator
MSGHRTSVYRTKLSPRQEEVLGMLKEGLTPREISVKLDLSVQRISQHVIRLRQKGALPPEGDAA